MYNSPRRRLLELDDGVARRRPGRICTLCLACHPWTTQKALLAIVALVAACELRVGLSAFAWCFLFVVEGHFESKHFFLWREASFTFGARLFVEDFKAMVLRREEKKGQSSSSPRALSQLIWNTAILNCSPTLGHVVALTMFSSSTRCLGRVSLSRLGRWDRGDPQHARPIHTDGLLFGGFLRGRGDLYPVYHGCKILG